MGVFKKGSPESMQGMSFPANPEGKNVALGEEVPVGAAAHGSLIDNPEKLKAINPDNPLKQPRKDSARSSSTSGHRN